MQPRPETPEPGNSTGKDNGNDIFSVCRFGVQVWRVRET